MGPGLLKLGQSPNVAPRYLLCGRSGVLKASRLQWSSVRYPCRAVADPAPPVEVEEPVVIEIDRPIDKRERDVQITDEQMKMSFRPVDEVCREAVRDGVVVVEGKVPSSLRGVLLKNGPNPVRVRSGEDGHAWDGDGMLHAVWFGGDEDAVEVRYKNRYVETLGRTLEERLAPNSHEPLFDGMKLTAGGVAQTMLLSFLKWSLPAWMLGLKQDENLRGDTDFFVPKKNVANTALVFHHNKLLALWEVGFPYAVDVQTLDTIGATSLGGSLTKAMSAHPKVDPITGEMIDVTYDLLRAPHCDVRVWNKDGKLLHKTSVEDISNPIMIHDSAITKNYTLILDMPLEFKLSLDVLNPRNLAQIKFNSKRQARIGLLPRFGCNPDIKWFNTSSGVIFHTINAYEENNRVVLKAILHVSNGTDLDIVNGLGPMNTKPWEFVLDLNTGETYERVIPCCSKFLEMPQINPDLLGQKARYGFVGSSNGDAAGFTFCEKLDLESKYHKPLIYQLPRGCFSNEFVFCPRAKRSQPQSNITEDTSDNGWLVAYVHDAISDKSEVHVVDAKTMELECRIALPSRVHSGIHSTFIPRDKLPKGYALV